MSGITVCIFEDDGYKNFGPLTETRAVWDIRCGAFTNIERIRSQILQLVPDCNFIYHIREYLTPLYQEIYSPQSMNPNQIDTPVIGINGRAILTLDSIRELITRLLASDKDLSIVKDDDVVAFITPKFNRFTSINKLIESYSAGKSDSTDINDLPFEVELVRYPWDLIALSGNKVIFEDFNLLQNSLHSIEVDSSQDHRIRVDPTAIIGNGVVLDASNGPIIIEENALIEPGAILQGPVHTGAYSIIRPGARLENVFMGPHCRVGGEVSNTIFQDYSNKQHSGYIGNSYIGSWVNLGAATDTSDLKNNYGMVSVNLNGELVDSGSRHVGSIIGDFVKTAIHTRLNTGTVVGTCCNLFGIDFPPKAVPPFTWVSSEGMVYRFDKALETIRMQMPRRKRIDKTDLSCELTPGLESVLRHIAADSSIDNGVSLI